MTKGYLPKPARDILAPVDNIVQRALAAPVLGKHPPEAIKDEKSPEFYYREAFSENSYRGYRSDLRDFIQWTGIENPFPVTPTVVAQYLAEHAQELAPTTLAHRRAALSFLHRLLGFQDPTESPAVTMALRGIRRNRIKRGWRPERAPAFTLEQLLAMLAPIGDSLSDVRDRAFLLVGFFGGFRQSELTALDISQLQWQDAGVAVTMDGIVKQDPLGNQVRAKAIPRIEGAGDHCPATALRAWLAELEKASITTGPVFRGISDRRKQVIFPKAMSKDTANRILQKWALRAGLPNASDYSCHSFRASFVTTLRGLDVPDARTARQTHHLNLATMQNYDRPETAFVDSPVEELAEEFARVLRRLPG
ncbi:MAG: tyrosine-type recombinase/integrase [Gammaproteobacteria bacterium]|nr:tyrosine-type recombinase/integrase [Gammaproteobacteria bacterium]